MESTVLNMTGPTGVGKTHLLEKFRDAHPGSLQIRAPRHPGERFDLTAADFENHAAVVLDELMRWDRASLSTGVAALEAQAIEQGKKLILVTQGAGDLEASGIALRTRPVLMTIEGRMQALTLMYAARRVRIVA